MLKKIGIALFVIVFISILIKFFTIDTSARIRVNNLIRQIPQSAAIILETDNIQRIIEELNDKDNELWLYLNGIGELKNFNNELLFLDSIFNADDEFTHLLRNNLADISLHFLGRNEPETLYLLAKPQNTKDEEIERLLVNIFEKHTRISEKEYEETKILIFKLNSNNKKSFYLYQDEKSILFSSSEILLEETIRKRDESNNFMDDKAFNSLYHSINKKALANIYVNFKNFPDLLSTFSSKSISLKTIGSFTHWAAFNLIIEDRAIIFSGITHSKSKKFNFLSLFKNQKPQKSSIIKILPENTSSFISVCFSDAFQLNSNHKKELKKHSSLPAYHKVNTKLEEKTGLDFEFFFNTYVDNEILVLYTNENKISEALLIAKINEAEEVKKELRLALDSLSKVQQTSAKENTQSIILGNDERIDILHLNINNPLHTFYGPVFKSRKAKYYAVFREYLVMASSVEKIESLITFYVKNKRFIQSTNYDEISNIAENKHTLLIYSNPVISKRLYYYLLNLKYANKLKKNEKKLNKLNAFTIQVSPNATNLFNIKFDLAYEPKKKLSVERNWNTKLDTSTSRKAQLFKNHYNGSREIFTQDDNNNIYLIDRSGNVVFKRHIKYKIIGKAKQIDFYANTKLQILFTAGDKLYLIDRNGENVEHFPIKLPAKATCAVAVFDYERNRDYRFFIATNNHRVYAFNKEGTQLSSWSFISKQVVKTPPKHIRIENKDFIIISTPQKLYINNRKGEERLFLDENVQLSDNAELFFMRGENPHLISTTRSGELVKIYFNGEVQNQSLGNIPPNHFFVMSDLDNDKKYEYILAHGKKIQVFNSKFKEIKSYEFDERISSLPSIYSFSKNKKMIGVHSKANKTVYLLSENLELHEMFPLYGNSPFVISYPERSSSGLEYSLITGSDNSGLVNYKITD